MTIHRFFRQIVLKSLFVLFVLILAFQSIGINGLAAPAARSIRSQDGGNLQPLTCSSPSVGGTPTYCDIQIVLLIDDSGSMRTNDPQKDPAGGLRNQGARNLVDILARQYYLPAVQLKADNPDVRLPNVQVAVVHFSADVKEYPKEYPKDWIQINPNSQADWEKQQVELYKLIDWKNSYATLQTTSFIGPFQKAAELFKLNEAQAQQGVCVNRSVLLFTDGTPENAGGILTGNALKQEMETVDATTKSIQDALPDDSKVKFYVTGFKINPKYWNLKYDNTILLNEKWTNIADYSPPPADNETLKRVQLVDSLDALPARMETITASLAGIQSLLVHPDTQDPQSYSIEIPKYVQLLRLTFYNSEPQAGLQITGPNGTELKADGENIVLSGGGTSIEVWELHTPLAGSYQIHASEPGGVITALLTYQSLGLEPSLEASQFQVGQPSDIRFTLVDGAGNVVPPNDASLKLNVSVTQDAQEFSPEWTGNAFQFPWTPKSEGKSQFKVLASLVGASGDKILDCSGDMEVEVPPSPVLSMDIAPACVSLKDGQTLPVQLNYSGADSAWADSLQWKVSAQANPNPGNQNVNAHINAVDTSAGRYEISIDPIADDSQIQELVINAEAQIAGQANTIAASKTVTVPVCASPPPCDCFPIWLIFIGLMMWLFILLLGWVLLRDKHINIRFWMLVLLEVVLAVIWFILFSDYRMHLLWMLLLLVILLIFLFLVYRRRIKEIMLWWLIILLTLFVSIWFILFGKFSIWLILLLLLLWLGILVLLWIFLRGNPPIWAWILLVLVLILALVSLIYFSAFWITLLLWLITILVLIMVVRVVGPICPPPAPPDDLTIIEGIGSEVEKLLNQNGIYTFNQLADTKVKDLNAMLDNTRWTYMDPKTWPRQAELAEAMKSDKPEDKARFKEYTDWLKDGIAPDEYNQPENTRKPPEE